MRLPYNQEIIDLKPSKIVCVAKNYKKHAAEMQSEIPEEPKFFLKPPSALIGHGDTVIIPQSSRRVEHEVELAVVIGSTCSKVSRDAVFEHILGYAIIVDVTARDLQKAARDAGMPWTVAKGYDSFAPFGPHIIPAQGVNPDHLDIWLKVNGKDRQRSNTSEMVYKTAELVSCISQVMTLEPWDIVATGTPEGVGPLLSGDSVEAGIQGIGVLEFKVRS